MQGSMFCGQLIGHDIKSRAAQTIILNNQIYSAEGGPPNCQAANTSFDIDVPNGGLAIIMDNTNVQGPPGPARLRGLSTRSCGLEHLGSSAASVGIARSHACWPGSIASCPSSRRSAAL